MIGKARDSHRDNVSSVLDYSKNSSQLHAYDKMVESRIKRDEVKRQNHFRNHVKNRSRGS
jgi:hypothetical protein